MQKWTTGMSEQESIDFLSSLKAWVKLNMRGKYRGDTEKMMSYVYFNERTFFLMKIEEGNDQTRFTFYSDN